MNTVNCNINHDDCLDFNDHFYFQQLLNYVESTIPPNSFYHYTKIDAVKKIISNSKISFRLSRADKMENDGICDEGRDIIDRYEIVCRKLYNDKKITSDFYQLIKNVTSENRTWFENLEHEYILSNLYYVGCFCLRKDCPKMIKRYGDYVLEFNQQFYNVGRSKANNHEQKDFRLVRVIYSDEEKDKILMKEIEWCYDMFNKHQKCLSLISKKIKSYILGFLQLNSLIFKNEKYEYEREIRIICCSEKGKTEKDDDGVYMEFGNPRTMLLSLTHRKTMNDYNEILKYIG